MNDIADVEWITQEQYEAGWHFCCDWGGLLIHTSHPEYESCACGYKELRRDSSLRRPA